MQPLLLQTPGADLPWHHSAAAGHDALSPLRRSLRLIGPRTLLPTRLGEARFQAHCERKQRSGLLCWDPVLYRAFPGKRLAPSAHSPLSPGLRLAGTTLGGGRSEAEGPRSRAPAFTPGLPGSFLPQDEFPSRGHSPPPPSRVRFILRKCLVSPKPV